MTPLGLVVRPLGWVVVSLGSVLTPREHLSAPKVQPMLAQGTALGMGYENEFDVQGFFGPLLV
jgi:hypothetical protein